MSPPRKPTGPPEHALWTQWLTRDLWTIEEFVLLIHGQEPPADPLDLDYLERKELLEPYEEMVTTLLRCVPTTLKPVREGPFPLLHQFRYVDLFDFAEDRRLEIDPTLLAMGRRKMAVAATTKQPDLMAQLDACIATVRRRAREEHLHWPETHTGSITTLHVPFSFREFSDVFAMAFNRKLSGTPSSLKRVRKNLGAGLGIRVAFKGGRPPGQDNRLLAELPGIAQDIRTTG